MVSFLVFLFILGLLIIVHEFGHFIMAKKVGVKVEKFSLGFGPSIFSKIKQGTEYSLNLIPLGGYVKLAGDNLEECKGAPYEYLAKSPKQRAAIIILGPLLNYILGALCFWLVFFVGYPTFTTKVGGLIEGFGAKAAGIQVGDKILAVDGQKTTYWEELQKLVQEKKTPSAIKLIVLRGSKQLEIEVKIKERQLQDALGQKQSVGLIGITPADETIKIKRGFWESAFLGIKSTLNLTVMTYKALWRMATGKLSFRESVTGPLGIFYITAQAASMGLSAVLHLVAVLSVSLSIFNLLPLPVLDGGHVLFLAIEKLRGRAFGLRTERLITNFGYTLIITLAVLVTYNDFLRFFGERLSKYFLK